MIFIRLARLAKALLKSNPTEGAKLVSLLKYAADYTYYRGIPVKIPATMYKEQSAAIDKGLPPPYTIVEMTEAIRNDAKKAIGKILNQGFARAEGYTKDEHYVTPHWEVAEYYATYMTERRIKNQETMLPVVISGTVDDKDLILDWHEMASTTNKWPDDEEITSWNFSDPKWLDFMHNKYGPDFDNYLRKYPATRQRINQLEQQINILKESSDPVAKNQITTLKKEVDKEKAKFFESLSRDPELIQHFTIGTGESVKNQVRIPTDKLEKLPVDHVLIGLTNTDGEIEFVEARKDNYERIIDSWVPPSPEIWKRYKKEKQQFEGMAEGYTSTLTF